MTDIRDVHRSDAHLLRVAATDRARRALDVVVSAALLVLTLPILLVVTVGSALALRAWPFFTQDRVGQGGEPFRFVKVRTLPPETPGYVDKHHLDADRIPAFCRALRALHLDELPQLLLVLRGRMSLVGPRPEMACLHERLPQGFAALRTSVRPGCTGLWQVSERCTELIGDAPEYDRFYLLNRGLRLDVWILVRTATQMLGIGSCITLEQIPRWALGDGRRAEVLALPRVEPNAEAQIRLPAAAGR